MSFIKNKKFLKTFILLPTIYLLVCSSPKNQSDEIILAKIGDKQISVSEFLQRSELSIRFNNFKGKNTTLDNLLSEKILALEAEQNDHESLTPVLQGKLNGDYIVMRVKDWVDPPLISGVDQTARPQEVTAILHKKQARKWWTVDDFRKEVMSHFLVFKTKNLNRNNFAERRKSYKYS